MYRNGREQWGWERDRARPGPDGRARGHGLPERRKGKAALEDIPAAGHWQAASGGASPPARVRFRLRSWRRRVGRVAQPALGPDGGQSPECPALRYASKTWRIYSSWPWPSAKTPSTLQLTQRRSVNANRVAVNGESTTTLLRDEPGPLASGKKEVRRNPDTSLTALVDSVLSPPDGGALRAREQHGTWGDFARYRPPSAESCNRSNLPLRPTPQVDPQVPLSRRTFEVEQRQNRRGFAATRGVKQFQSERAPFVDTYQRRGSRLAARDAHLTAVSKAEIEALH